jgi:hypothetical protein
MLLFLPPHTYVLERYDRIPTGAELSGEINWLKYNYRRCADIPIAVGGTTQMFTLDWSSLPCRSASASGTVEALATGLGTLTFVAPAVGEEKAVSLTVTDPTGKVISATRNDFGAGSAYGFGDMNEDGLKDLVVLIATPLSGRYTIAWTASPTASPDATLTLFAWQDNQSFTLLDGVALYQRGQRAPRADRRRERKRPRSSEAERT